MSNPQSDDPLVDFSSEPFSIENEYTIMFINRLLLQDRQNTHFRRQLEARIESDSIALHTLRAYCVQLQNQNTLLESQMSNHQVSLRSATESCQIISRDLALERIRVQDLEARLKELHPSIETLLQNIHLDQPHVPDPEFSSQQQTIQYQQELICSLQGIIRAREEMIEELGLSLDDVFEDALGDHGGQEAPHRPKEEGAPLPESPESGFSIDIITE